MEMAEVLTHSQVVQFASYAVPLAAHSACDTTGFISPGAERGRKTTLSCVAPPPRTDSSSTDPNLEIARKVCETEAHLVLCSAPVFVQDMSI